MNKSLKKYYGFTLVELIIVITILAILSTIAFVSFQNYTTQSRDTNRITTIKSIEKGLQITNSITSTYPTPDLKVDILASGSVIGYQGYAGDSVLNIIKSSKALDPVDNNYYTYLVNKKSTKYQLMILAETQNLISLLPKTLAGNRYPKVFGDNLGIITDLNYKPIQETGTGVDINTATGTYKAFISNGTTEINGTGVILTALNVSMGGVNPKSCLEILNSKQGNTDGIYQINPTGTGSFSVYCDMTKDSGGWTMIVRTVTGSLLHRDTNYVGNLTGPLQSTTYKLSDAVINTIPKTIYRGQNDAGQVGAYFDTSDVFKSTAQSNSKAKWSYTGSTWYGPYYDSIHWGFNTYTPTYPGKFFGNDLPVGVQAGFIYTGNSAGDLTCNRKGFEIILTNLWNCGGLVGDGTSGSVWLK